MLKGLKYKTDLFSAAKKDVQTGYNLVWLRDNIYALLGFEAAKQFTQVRNTLRAILDILLKHEQKIDWAIEHKPTHSYQFIHARYNPLTKEEIWQEWGNKQNDAIGAILFKIGELELKGKKIIRNKDDIRILQKVVNYLASIEYWHCPDNGMWEEAEELHASSIGACVAGLKKMQSIVDVNPSIIKKGEAALKKLLPKESATKDVDLALLSLIYPYNVVSPQIAEKILENVENHLVRERGVIRYKGDVYYSNGAEAEWTMGLPWLSIIYQQLKKPGKQSYYLLKTLNAMNSRGELPELYFGNTHEHNDNTPLAWSQSLAAVMHSLE